MQGMSGKVAEVADNSNQASEASRKAADTTRQGGVIVEDTLVKMRASLILSRKRQRKSKSLAKAANQPSRAERSH